MTYGWALLVVLIAIAALASFGLLNPSRFLPDKAELSPGLTVVDFGSNNGFITLIVNNGLGKTIYNFKMNISTCDDGAGITNVEELL